MARTLNLKKNLITEDRISSLPNELLIDILSLVPIKTAVATSRVSRRWRNLWTQLNRVEFYCPKKKLPDFKDHHNRVISKLDSPDIRAFHFYFDIEREDDDTTPLSSGKQEEQFAKSYLELVCTRNVKEIKVIVQEIEIPSCVFDCQSLETLIIDGVLNCNNLGTNNPEFSLPNLKKLSLDLSKSSSRILSSSVFKSCPLLEELHLSFYRTKSQDTVEICGPNLKVLDISSWGETRKRKVVVIDAPKLVNFSVQDCSSRYLFVEKPTALSKARFELCRACPDHENIVRAGTVDAVYLTRMSSFFLGLSSISYLEFRRHVSILQYLEFEEGCSVLFSNLTHLKITSCDWKDLLPSLHYLPNLEVLDVFCGLAAKPSNWSFPDPVPVCLVRNIKKMFVGSLAGTDSELSLLQYILSNAAVLERLLPMFYETAMCSTDRRHLLMRNNFTASVLELPRRSSICQIEFSEEYINPQKMPSRPSHTKFYKYYS